MSLRQILKQSKLEYKLKQQELQQKAIYGDKNPTLYANYPPPKLKKNNNTSTLNTSSSSSAIKTISRQKNKRRKISTTNKTATKEEKNAIADAEIAEFTRLDRCHKEAQTIFFNNETGLLKIESQDKSTQGLIKKKLDKHDFTILSKFYNETLKPSIPHMMEWGESEKDPRRRGYLCMKRAGGTDRLLMEGIKMNPVTFSGNKAINIHRKTYNKSFIDYAFDEENNQTDQEILNVLQKIVQFVHDKVERKYRAYVTLENLVAMQPNLHHETEHLPLHYDTPRNDGFGVVIVTVCMNGQGDIVIVDDGDKGETISKKFKFNIKQGELYVLSGHARNKCLHGVICKGYGNRESLNLRFGLHTRKFAFDEVDQHWPWA